MVLSMQNLFEYYMMILPNAIEPTISNATCQHYCSTNDGVEFKQSSAGIIYVAWYDQYIHLIENMLLYPRLNQKII